MNKTYKLLIGTILSLGLGTVSLAQNANAANPFTQFYNNNCVPEAKKAGLTQSEAQQICNCTVESLRKKYSTQAFSNLYAQYRNGDNTARRTLTRYGQNCSQEVLDDILWE
ncbi:hypothetical protein [Cyanothece sp. BG0011]|uniref:hypothetical protein n=1 Tax=Cyanothece sp. BG0011 TaxID=2082950 RepID=UPI000D1F814E|nr:hypothetical protein [Cyanothece sp. BG0011]